MSAPTRVSESMSWLGYRRRSAAHTRSQTAIDSVSMSPGLTGRRRMSLQSSATATRERSEVVRQGKALQLVDVELHLVVGGSPQRRSEPSQAQRADGERPKGEGPKIGRTIVCQRLPPVRGIAHLERADLSEVVVGPVVHHVLDGEAVRDRRVSGCDLKSHTLGQTRPRPGTEYEGHRVGPAERGSVPKVEQVPSFPVLHGAILEDDRGITSAPRGRPMR